jgi:hypothetical protein
MAVGPHPHRELTRSPSESHSLGPRMAQALIYLSRCGPTPTATELTRSTWESHSLGRRMAQALIYLWPCAPTPTAN